MLATGPCWCHCRISILALFAWQGSCATVKISFISEMENAVGENLSLIFDDMDPPHVVPHQLPAVVPVRDVLDHAMASVVQYLNLSRKNLQKLTTMFLEFSFSIGYSEERSSPDTRARYLHMQVPSEGVLAWPFHFKHNCGIFWDDLRHIRCRVFCAHNKVKSSVE